MDGNIGKHYGKVISSAVIDQDGERIVLRFADGTYVSIVDHQSCCEHRYFHTDDDLSALAGARLVAVTEKEGPEEEDEYGHPLESMFLEIQTDRGFATVTAYNSHNGYYGGFHLDAREDYIAA